jgi:hypothetical protein
MQHADNVDTIGERQVKDHVAAHHKTTEVFTQLRSGAAHSWMTCQKLKRIVDPRGEGVGMVRTVIANVRPDFGQISQSSRTFDDAPHLLRAISPLAPSQPLAAL